MPLKNLWMMSAFLSRCFKRICIPGIIHQSFHRGEKTMEENLNELIKTDSVPIRVKSEDEHLKEIESLNSENHKLLDEIA